MAATTKYSYLRMEPADNGVIVSWDEESKSPSASKSTFENSTYSNKKHVFDFEDAGEAIKLFCDIASKISGKTISYEGAMKDSDEDGE